MTFLDACDRIEMVLAGSARRQIVDAACRAKNLGAALETLARQMASDDFGVIDLSSIVQPLDERTRAEGFNVMNDWDGVAVKIRSERILVDCATFVASARHSDAADPRVAAIVLDYYFLHVLSLLSLRAWDDGHADANLDRLSALVPLLQGEQSSGHRFVTDAESLIIVGTSHYEPEEHGYTSLLERVQLLSRPHQLRIAAGHAAALGCHLRFGFEATYGRNTTYMRDDNVADYPWLTYSVKTLLRALADGYGVPDDARPAVTEALFGGLSADTPLLLSDPEIASLYGAQGARLCEEFRRLRPLSSFYSPLSLFFNFSFNVLKGQLVDAMLWGEPWPYAINDLFAQSSDLRRAKLCETLTNYARKNPDLIRGKLMPVIVYDPPTGRRAFDKAMDVLTGAAGPR